MASHGEFGTWLVAVLAVILIAGAGVLLWVAILRLFMLAGLL